MTTGVLGKTKQKSSIRAGIGEEWMARWAAKCAQPDRRRLVDDAIDVANHAGPSSNLTSQRLDSGPTPSSADAGVSRAFGRLSGLISAPFG
jgi:hypothetical protein